MYQTDGQPHPAIPSNYGQWREIVLKRVVYSWFFFLRKNGSVLSHIRINLSLTPEGNSCCLLGDDRKVILKHAWRAIRPVIWDGLWGLFQRLWGVFQVVND